jgi:hypothetical protein
MILSAIGADIKHDVLLLHESKSNAALQLPGDNCASGKLSMRGVLIPVRCKRLLSCPFNESLNVNHKL